MSREALIDQVAGILMRHDIKYLTREDGQEYLARFGSTGVHVSFVGGEEETIVLVRAPVVQELQLDQAARQRLLERLNAVNRELLQGRIYLHEDVVQLEAEVPGEDLQAATFMKALSHVARLADTLDDELVGDYGGLTFQAKWEQGQPDEAVET